MSYIVTCNLYIDFILSLQHSSIIHPYLLEHCDIIVVLCKFLLLMSCARVIFVVVPHDGINVLRVE